MVENEDLPLDKVGDSPVIPRMRLSKVFKNNLTIVLKYVLF